MKQGISYVFIGLGVFFVAEVCQSQENLTLIGEAPPSAPTVVYGSANDGDGARNTVLLEQSGDENPLGNPLVSEDISNTENDSPQEKPSFQPTNSEPIKNITELLSQNPKISAQESPQQVNKQIQNTLYESGGRIYDIQSYPAKDINYIEEKNINPTITTYPAY